MEVEKSIPKQELLIKLLKMSTSPNDGEALIAVRKANELLVSAGWDWEKLIHGKIKVIEDPFKNLGVPQSNGHTIHTTHVPNTPPPRTYTPRPPPPPPPPPLRGTPSSPLSTRPNLYAGNCHCCGIEVVASAGVCFKSHNQTNWKIACNTCNTSAFVASYPAAPQRVKGRKAVNDLA